jgi:hypothetical protein
MFFDNLPLVLLCMCSDSTVVSWLGGQLRSYQLLVIFIRNLKEIINRIELIIK